MEAREITEMDGIVLTECWHLCQDCSERWEHRSDKYQKTIVHESYCIFKRFATCTTCLKRIANGFPRPISLEEELYDTPNGERIESSKEAES